MITATTATKPLTLSEIKKVAPSVFAEAPHKSRSERYSMVKTVDMIQNFEKTGWYPARVTEERSAKYKGFQRHQVAFRQDFTAQKYVPEILFLNSHNGRTKCVFKLGIFRLVCSNGLVRQTMSMGSASAIHVGINQSEFVKKLDHYVIQANETIKEIRKYESVALDDSQRMSFAITALKTVYPERFDQIAPASLLEVRRDVDNETDLWTTFNVVQENIIKGGLQYVIPRDSANDRNARTKPITNIHRNNAVNMVLWALMAEFYTKVK